MSEMGEKERDRETERTHTHTHCSFAIGASFIKDGKFGSAASTTLGQSGLNTVINTQKLTGIPVWL